MENFINSLTRLENFESASTALPLEGGTQQAAAQFLAEFLLRRPEALRSLELHSNIDSESIELLSESLSKSQCRHLERLSFRNAQLPSSCLLYLGRMLSYNKGLEYVGLGNNPFGGKIADLAPGLSVNQTLIELSLWHTGIAFEGVEILADILKVNHTLRCLNLGENSIDASATAILGEALMVNDSLMVLHLSSNKLGDAGAASLSTVLSVNPRLRRLSLKNCGIGSVGANELLNAIKGQYKSPNGLHKLTLQKNQINNELRRQINMAICKNVPKWKKNHKDVFLEILNSDKKIKWNRARLMFVGQGRVGKTATVRALLGKPFDVAGISTIGAELSESETKLSNSAWTLNDHKKKDTSLASQFAARMMTNSSGYVSLTAQEKIELLKNPVATREERTHTIKKVHKKEQRVPKVNEPVESNNGVTLVSRNASSSASAGSNEIKQAKKTRSSRKRDIIREYDENLLLNAKKNADLLNLSLWDFGGQEVFYTMHHLFLTESGIYIVVFDMRELVHSPSTDATKSLSFWLKSIKLHAPAAPVFIVGTFANALRSKDEVQIIDKEIRNLHDSFFPQAVVNRDENLSFFPVDNQDSFGIESLRTIIETVCRKDKSVRQEVSIRWINLLDEILFTRKNNSYITLPLVKEMAFSMGITGNAEIDTALRLFDERGMIIHLTSTETLKNIIVVKPQWLIDGLSKVIRDDSIHMYDTSEIDQVGLLDDLNSTFCKAITTRDFLEYVWQDSHEVDFFVDLMKRTMLLSEWSYSGKEHYYLVPSLLREVYQYREKSGIRCVFDFSDSFLPPGVFERLISLCLGHAIKYSESRIPVVYSNYASFEFDRGFDCSLHLEAERITIRTGNPEYASKCVHIFHSMFSKLNADVMGQGLSWKLLLEEPKTHELVEQTEAQNRKMIPWFPKRNSMSPAAAKVDLDLFLDGLQNYGP